MWEYLPNKRIYADKTRSVDRLNATHQNITIQPIKKGQEIFIVIGEKLNKEKITTNLMGTQTPLC